MHALAARRVTRVAECGPGKILNGLLKRIERAIDGRPLGGPAELNQALHDWR
jgi:[acyl-carrier-protein] S-malonyltransferase